MIQAGKTYIYGTAAEKLEYDVYEENKVLRAKKKQKSNNKVKFKLVLNILVIFTLFFLVMYRYAMITELTYNIDKANTKYNQLRNDNQNIKVSIEKGLDLNNVKQIAETKLGMQKPDKYQITYIKVPKTDYTRVADTYKQSEKSKENVFALIVDNVGKFSHLLY